MKFDCMKWAVMGTYNTKNALYGFCIAPFRWGLGEVKVNGVMINRFGPFMWSKHDL